MAEQKLFLEIKPMEAHVVGWVSPGNLDNKKLNYCNKKLTGDGELRALKP